MRSRLLSCARMNEEKPAVVSRAGAGVADGQPVIKSADMAEDMQQVAVTVAAAAMQKNAVEKDVRAPGSGPAHAPDRGTHQARVRRQVRPDLARRRRQELWQLLHPWCAPRASAQLTAQRRATFCTSTSAPSPSYVSPRVARPHTR